MITWLLIIFLHDVRMEGIEEQVTAGKFSSWMKCEEVRKQAISKKDLECIGIEVSDFPIQEDARTLFYSNKKKNLHDFKMNQWW
jgi:hypothetical protein